MGTPEMISLVLKTPSLKLSFDLGKLTLELNAVLHIKNLHCDLTLLNVWIPDMCTYL